MHLFGVDVIQCHTGFTSFEYTRSMTTSLFQTQLFCCCENGITGGKIQHTSCVFWVSLWNILLIKTACAASGPVSWLEPYWTGSSEHCRSVGVYYASTGALDHRKKEVFSPRVEGAQWGAVLGLSSEPELGKWATAPIKQTQCSQTSRSRNYSGRPVSYYCTVTSWGTKWFYETGWAEASWLAC